MTKLLAVLSVFAVLAATLPAQACPFNDQKTAQSTPVVTSDAAGAAPMTPVPPPPPTTAPKTGG
jgi:hypothetical protein